MLQYEWFTYTVLLLVKHSVGLPTLVVKELIVAFEGGPFEAQLPLHSYHHSGSSETLTPLWTALIGALLKYVFVAVAVQQLEHPSRISAIIKLLHSFGRWMKCLLKVWIFSPLSQPLTMAIIASNVALTSRFSHILNHFFTFSTEVMMDKTEKHDKDETIFWMSVDHE